MIHVERERNTDIILGYSYIIFDRNILKDIEALEADPKRSAVKFDTCSCQLAADVFCPP